MKCGVPLPCLITEGNRFQQDKAMHTNILYITSGFPPLGVKLVSCSTLEMIFHRTDEYSLVFSFETSDFPQADFLQGLHHQKMGVYLNFRSGSGTNTKRLFQLTLFLTNYQLFLLQEYVVLRKSFISLQFKSMCFTLKSPSVPNN